LGEENLSSWHLNDKLLKTVDITTSNSGNYSRIVELSNQDLAEDNESHSLN